METGYFREEEVIIDYKEYDLDHKDKDGNILYIEHIKEPIKEIKKIWIEYTEDEILEQLRTIRELECFSVINRGKLWYDTLTEGQIIELSKWYQSWLNVTETKFIPTKPSWLN